MRLSCFLYVSFSLWPTKAFISPLYPIFKTLSTVDYRSGRPITQLDLDTYMAIAIICVPKELTDLKPVEKHSP